MSLLTNNYSWYLEGIMPGGKSWIIPIDKFPFTVGRNTDCNLCLNSVNISRKHARFITKDREIYIEDLKSTNGTKIDNKKIKKEQILKNNNTITFGEFEFKIHNIEPDHEVLYSKTVTDSTTSSGSKFIKNFKLTKKEAEILILLLKGTSTQKIGDKLSISAGTAKNHILNIYKKTDTHSKFELFALYNQIENQK